jgi:hypothetical protein
MVPTLVLLAALVTPAHLMLGEGDPKNPPTIILNGFDFERK